MNPRLQADDDAFVEEMSGFRPRPLGSDYCNRQEAAVRASNAAMKFRREDPMQPRTDSSVPQPENDPTPRRRRRLAIEHIRYAAVIGAATALFLSAVTYLWALGKAVTFVHILAVEGLSSDPALVKLFESIDSILIATVLLIVGFGVWELFVHDLDLPPSLTTTSFDHLKGRIAGTLALVLAVRYLERLISKPSPEEILALGISTALVGGLLLVFATSRRSH